MRRNNRRPVSPHARNRQGRKRGKVLAGFYYSGSGICDSLLDGAAAWTGDVHSGTPALGGSQMVNQTDTAAAGVPPATPLPAGTPPAAGTPAAPPEGEAPPANQNEAVSGKQITLATMAVTLLAIVPLFLLAWTTLGTWNGNWAGGGWQNIRWAAGALAGWAGLAVVFGSLVSAAQLIFTSAHKEHPVMTWVGVGFLISFLLAGINYRVSTDLEPGNERASHAALIAKVDTNPDCSIEKASTKLRGDRARFQWQQDCRVKLATAASDRLEKFWLALLGWLTASFLALLGRKSETAESARKKLAVLGDKVLQSVGLSGR